MAARKRIAVLQVLLCVMIGAYRLAAQDAAQPPAADPSGPAQPAAHAEVPKSLFGKPEKISGTISMVLPEKRLIVLTVPATSVPKFLMVLEDTTTVTQKPEGTVKHHKRVILTQADEVTFDFKVTDSTAITVGGRRLTSGSLAGLNNKQATVRFVARASGNTAQAIEVVR
ncbi:MAG TPA: hypothetical protein VKU44_04545 [Terriglobia bacterium]|nr:hypothetical protein [Terriglobia bacterium]